MSAKRGSARAGARLRSAADAGKSERDLARSIAEEAHANASKAGSFEFGESPLHFMDALGIEWKEGDCRAETGAKLEGDVVAISPDAGRHLRSVGIYRCVAALLLRERGWRPEPVILDLLAGELMLPTRLVHRSDARTADELGDLQVYVEGEHLFKVLLRRANYWSHLLKPSKVVDLATFRRQRDEADDAG